MRNTNLDRRKEIFDVFNDVLNDYRASFAFEDFKAELEYWGIHNLLYVNYMDVFRINPNAQLLEDYLSYLNDFFPQWSKNKYFNKISFSRRMLIYSIKYRLKFILSLLTKVLR